MDALSIIDFFVRRKISKILTFSERNFQTVKFSDFEKFSERVKFLYIHIPFCLELCPYCSFHRVKFEKNFALKYFDALNKEILMYKDKNFNFNAIYVGGGTPTIMIEGLEKILNTAKDVFDVKTISVETNPDINEKTVEVLRNLKVNRLSVGVQTFNNKILNEIKRDRYGSGEEIKERIKHLDGKFDTVNIDMIFNFPSQTEEILKNDLKILLEILPDQITYYPLMPSSLTEKKISKEIGRIDYKKEKKFYEIIVENLRNNYDFSSVWCFSRKNNKNKYIDEYVINYDEYACAGSGGFGYINGSIYVNTFDIKKYIEWVNNKKFPIEISKKFSLNEQILNDILMKLFGLKIDINEIEKKYKIKEIYLSVPEILFFMLIGALRKEKNFMYLTDKGRYYWLMMMRNFFTGVNNFRDYCRKKANL